jgi:hypothetical protein
MYVCTYVRSLVKYVYLNVRQVHFVLYVDKIYNYGILRHMPYYTNVVISVIILFDL